MKMWQPYSSGDISAEPVSGQKIEEHFVTDQDLRNDENRRSCYVICDPYRVA